MKGQIVPPEDTPPCILHTETRTSEKNLQQVFVRGMVGPSAGELEQFKKNVEQVVNTEIFGNTSAELGVELGRWKLPLKDGKLGEIKFQNVEARTMMHHFDKLIDVCLTSYDEDYREKWRKCGQKFREMMEMLRWRKHFSFEDVCKFQKLVDEYFDIYNYLTGVEGMTNYLHSLRAGHFSYFLNKYGNLYMWSQQGWEFVNGKMKQTYHHNTQKGGGIGKDGARGSHKLEPVMLTFIRSALWRFGVLDRLFDKLVPLPEHGIELEYGRTPQTHYDKRISDE